MQNHTLSTSRCLVCQKPRSPLATVCPHCGNGRQATVKLSEEEAQSLLHFGPKKKSPDKSFMNAMNHLFAPRLEGDRRTWELVCTVGAAPVIIGAILFAVLSIWPFYRSIFFTKAYLFTEPLAGSYTLYACLGWLGLSPFVVGFITVLCLLAYGGRITLRSLD